LQAAKVTEILKPTSMTKRKGAVRELAGVIGDSTCRKTSQEPERLDRFGRTEPSVGIHNHGRGSSRESDGLIVVKKWVKAHGAKGPFHIYAEI
jgi:hypothetical protein